MKRAVGICLAKEVCRQNEGQMVVEMAVVAPVMIVMAIVVFNIMMFMVAVARFDRVAFDAVLALAVSPEGEASDYGQEHAVGAAIEEAMGAMRGVTVKVQAEPAWRDSATGGVGFSCAPHLTRYRCVLLYEPWPQGFTVAGVSAGMPPKLRHERSLVVDRYRSGVVFS